VALVIYEESNFSIFIVSNFSVYKLRVTSCGLRVLGIDPGTATVGWAILEEKEGKIIPAWLGKKRDKKTKVYNRYRSACII